MVLFQSVWSGTKIELAGHDRDNLAHYDQLVNNLFSASSPMPSLSVPILESSNGRECQIRIGCKLVCEGSLAWQHACSSKTFGIIELIAWNNLAWLALVAALAKALSDGCVRAGGDCLKSK